MNKNLSHFLIWSLGALVLIPGTAFAAEELTITKNCTPVSCASPDSFPFIINDSNGIIGSSFTLDNMNSYTKTFPNFQNSQMSIAQQPTNLYDIIESTPSGWDAPSISCADTNPSSSPYSNITFTYSTNKATFDYTPNAMVPLAHITCTFTNNVQEEAATDMCANMAGAQTTVPSGYTVDAAGNCMQPIPDLCSNVAGAQTTVPSGYTTDAAGNCVQVDMCANISGTQSTVPSGYTMDATDNCTQPVSDLCSNVAGAQSTIPSGYTVDATGNCTQTVTIADMCANMAGTQVTAPSGYTIDAAGNCTQTVSDLCSNIPGTQSVVQAGYTIDAAGNCIQTTTITDMCVNIAGDQTTVPSDYTTDAAGDCVQNTGGGNAGGPGGMAPGQIPAVTSVHNPYPTGGNVVPLPAKTFPVPAPTEKTTATQEELPQPQSSVETPTPAPNTPTVSTPAPAPEKIQGFFPGIWNGFTNFFKRSPAAPAPSAPPSAPAPSTGLATLTTGVGGQASEKTQSFFPGIWNSFTNFFRRSPAPPAPAAASSNVKVQMVIQTAPFTYATVNAPTSTMVSVTGTTPNGLITCPLSAGVVTSSATANCSNVTTQSAVKLLARPIANATFFQWTDLQPFTLTNTAGIFNACTFAATFAALDTINCQLLIAGLSYSRELRAVYKCNDTFTYNPASQKCEPPHTTACYKYAPAITNCGMNLWVNRAKHGPNDHKVAIVPAGLPSISGCLNIGGTTAALQKNCPLYFNAYPTTVTLTATPPVGTETFAWSGPCISGTGGTSLVCKVTVTPSPVTVFANYSK